MNTARHDAFAALSASITATIAEHVSGVMVRVTASKARGLFVIAKAVAYPPRVRPPHPKERV